MEYCDEHKHNTAEINKMIGYWKILFWGGITFISALGSFCIYQNAQTQAIRSIANSLEITVTAYMATADQQTKHMLYMIENMDKKIESHDKLLHKPRE